MDNQQLQFKSAFNGFNKDEVIGYIESLNIKYRKMEASYKQELEDLRSNDGKEDIAALKKENDELKKRIAALEEYEQTVQSNPYKEKADLYDKMSSQLGSMIIMANDKAEDIINSANVKVEEAKNEIRLQIDSLNNQIYNEFVLAIENYTQEFSEFNNLIREVCGKLNARTEEIKNRMNKRNYELKQSLINEINELRSFNDNDETI